MMESLNTRKEAPLHEPWMVMVVEDHDELREATVSFLQQQGFETVGVACAEAVDETPTYRMPDLYVVDLNLPGEDGLALAGRLRQAQPNAGIVITTARTAIDDRLQGYAMGADIYLPKPVDPKELAATLAALGKRLARRDLDGTLALDGQKLRLRGPSGECRLAESEVRVLAAMASAKDQTLDRAQVAARLSLSGDEISADNLQNRISQLRRKIESCGIEGEVIKAIRGSGYRLCVPMVVV